MSIKKAIARKMRRYERKFTKGYTDKLNADSPQKTTQRLPTPIRFGPVMNQLAAGQARLTRSTEIFHRLHLLKCAIQDLNLEPVD